MRKVGERRTVRFAAIAAVAAAFGVAMSDVACDSDTASREGGLDLDHAPTASSVAALGFARPVADTVAAGDALLVIYEDKDLGVFDLGDPKNPQAGADVPTAARVLAVDYDAERQLAYVVDASGVVSIVGVRSATGATVLATTKVPDLGGDAKALARVGDRVFVLGASRLHPLRVSFAEEEPSGLTAEASVALDVAATHLAAGADTLFVAQSGEVRAFTVGPEGPPVAGATFAVGGDVRSVLAKGSKLLVLAKDVGMKIVDFANPSAPTQIHAVPELKDVVAAKLFGRTLAVGLERGAFSTIDLANFTNPRALTTNKGALPKFLAIQGGYLISGTGSRGEVGGVPPVVAAAVPDLQRASFPVNAPIPVVFSKAIDPASATTDSVKLTCGEQAIAGSVVVSLDRLTVTFRPASALPTGASCTLDVSGIRDAAGIAVASGANPPKVELKTSPSSPAAITNAGSAYRHAADGAFSDWAEGATQFEWFDVRPAKGMYSYFYADFDGQNLWLLNDWFFAGEKIDPDCYNQFGVWTGGGAERWDIRAYGDKRIEVRKDGKLVDVKSTGIEGGYSFGPSPNVKAAHTMYELKIPAAAGGWGVQLHDPGPTFSCAYRMGDPAPLTGGLGGGGGPKGSSVDYAQLTAPTAPASKTPENGAREVPLLPTPILSWATDGRPEQFVAYAIEIAADEAFTKRLYWRWTYGTSFALPRALLAPGRTYFWRVVAFNWLGRATSNTFSFTTAAPPPSNDGGTDGGDAGNDAGDAGTDASDAGADANDGGFQMCPRNPPPSCNSFVDTCGCQTQFMAAAYAMKCSGGTCTCTKNGTTTVTFQQANTCMNAGTTQDGFIANCPCN
jgi:hypothetical protein